MAILDVVCPGCNGLNVIKHGKLQNGEQRYRCCSSDCDRNTFILNYRMVCLFQRN
ncbi:MAG: IS1 family transposase [Magnetococcales bacterium]|nr:IS1 family transposase [Magnetococcales bacterium]